MFPILALRDFVYCAEQCRWHFPSKPDAQQLWMVIFTLYFHPRLEPRALAPHTLLFYPILSQLHWSNSWAWSCHLFSLSHSMGLQSVEGQLTWEVFAACARGRVLKPGLRWGTGDKWEFWPWLTTWESQQQLCLEAVMQMELVKNRAFSRQTYSHMHMDPQNINRRLKHGWGWCFPLLVPCASTSFSHVNAISLCNSMQEQPTCWVSNGDYTDSHLSNLSFAALFETESTNMPFNTLGTTKFEVTLRDSYTDS